jgi:outer membrane protein TolC
VPALLLIVLFSPGLRAQTPSQKVTGPSSAVKLPAQSSSNQNGVTVTQRTTNAGGGNSVDVIDSSVSAQAPFNGSVPNGVAIPGEIALTFEKALDLGLHYNLGAIDQAQSVRQAAGERQIARSALMPNLNAAISEELERLNLREMGVESQMFPVTATFNFFDARAAMLNQTVFDLVKIDNLHSATESFKASLKAVRDTRDLIVLAVAGGYLQLIATSARIAAATAQVETSRAINQQASDRFAAGLSARLDATRSKVQLQTEEERLRSLQADLETEKLRMARMIGLPLAQNFSLADQFRYAPLMDLPLESALAKAVQQRSDLQAASSRVKAADEALKAARAERMPNLDVTADWGAGGLRPTRNATSVYTIAGTLTIPLYEGGRIHGDIEQAAAVLAQRRADLENLRVQVEQDVRQAYIDLGSAADQVEVARSNVDLAHDTLNQSRDRFAQGVADTVEVVQAEQTVVQADDDYINAVYEHNLAKISLARAMGDAEQMLPQLLRK